MTGREASSIVGDDSSHGNISWTHDIHIDDRSERRVVPAHTLTTVVADSLEERLSKFVTVSSALLLLSAVGAAVVQADAHDRTLAVVMTNDANANRVKVYDGKTGALLQTLSTNGKGGAGNNARGVQQLNGELFAAVNNGSNSVALFRRSRTGLTFEKLVTTTSAPVSIDFANNHMYVAGDTTVDSFAIDDGRVGWLDGTTTLVLADGAVPPAGSHQPGWRDQRPSADRHSEERSGPGHR